MTRRWITGTHTQGRAGGSAAAAVAWLPTHLPFLLLLLIALPFICIRLDTNPPTWYDEGLNLAASRSLAETGIYALPSADGLRVADPAIQTGPPLLLPLALLYRLTGPDLAAARLAMSFGALLTVTALYALAYRLYGRPAAYLAALLLLALPGDSTANTIALSRQVLGELPSVLCLALGLHLLLARRERLLTTALAGVCFGLAVALKSQMLVVLSITTGVYGLAECLRDRSALRRWLAVAAGMVFVYALDWLWRTRMPGAAGAQNLAVLIEGALIHIIPLRPLDNLAQAGVLLRFGAGLGAVAGVWWLHRRTPALRPAQPAARRVGRFIALFVLIWMVWYAWVSIGWQRYSYIGLVFTCLLAGFALAWPLRRWEAARYFYPLTMLIFAVVVALQHTPDLLHNRQGDDFYAAAAYLKREIAPDAAIATWEWPMRYLLDHRFVYPRTTDANAITAAIFFDRPYDPARYDALAACPDYVLLGSFRVDRYVLQAALAAADPEPLFAQGDYAVYRVLPERLPAACRNAP